MDTKESLRAEIRRRRRERAAAERERAAYRLAAVVLARPEVRDARRVTCYLSAPEEPGTDPLREALRAAGVEVLLPVVTGDRLDWARDDGRTAPGRFGLRQPVAPVLGARALQGCDVLLVPALAVDGAGARLGQGAGYYDRALGEAPARGPVVALVHDDELLPAGAVPVEPHDRRVDAAATPGGWVDLTPG